MNEERPILYLTEFRCSNFPSMRSETLKPVWGTGTRPYFETSSYWFIFISFQNEKEKKNLRELPSRVVQSCFRHSIENWATLTELFSIFIDLSIWLRHRIFASYVRTAHSGLKRGTHKKNISTRNKIDAVFVSLKKKTIQIDQNEIQWEFTHGAIVSLTDFYLRWKLKKEWETKIGSDFLYQ